MKLEENSEDDCREASFSTRIISTKFAKPDVYGAIGHPIYRTAAFEFASSEAIEEAFKFGADAYTYSRITNPSVNHLEEKIKQASGAKSVMSMASGMAAISNTFLTIARMGTNIVASPHLFGNTFSFLKFTLAEFGVEVRFVNTDNLQEVENAIDENTCAFFAELITNPHMEVADLSAISKILRSKNVPMVIDSTIVPWCSFDARKAGVDIEVVSTTKYVSGGATSIGGAILDYGTHNWENNKKLEKLNNPQGLSKFVFKLRAEIGRNVGACMSPDTAHLQAMGLETLEVRYNKMADTTYRLASYLEDHPKVVKSNYPTLASSPYKKISDQLFSMGAGAMFTLSLDSKLSCYKFMNELKIIRRATNLFDNKTLAIHPESTIYGSFSPEMKKTMGIEDNLIRFSVGLESFDDLRNDIEQALLKV